MSSKKFVQGSKELGFLPSVKLGQNSHKICLQVRSTHQVSLWSKCLENIGLLSWIRLPRTDLNPKSSQVKPSPKNPKVNTSQNVPKQKVNAINMTLSLLFSHVSLDLQFSVLIKPNDEGWMCDVMPPIDANWCLLWKLEFPCKLQLVEDLRCSVL